MDVIRDITNEYGFDPYGESIPTVKIIKFTADTYMPGQISSYSAQITVAIPIRGIQWNDSLILPGGNRPLYESHLVITTNFTGNSFTINKNRFGRDNIVLETGVSLKTVLFNDSFANFDESSREILWSEILNAMIDITDHEGDFIMNRDYFIKNNFTKPKKLIKKLNFGY